MREIIQARIDDRLLHGQVVVKWIPYLEVDTVIIIDNELDSNSFLKRVTLTAAPKNIQSLVTSIEGFVECYEKAKGRTLLIAKKPQVFEKLINQGIDIKKVILGGMGSCEGRHNLYRNIHVSGEEIDSLIKITELSIEVNIQIIPDDKAKNILKIDLGR